MDARQNLLILILAVAVSSADAEVLEPLMSGESRVATHLRDIDSGALATLKHAFSNEHRLADRGAAFEATDVIVSNAPSRRLVLAVYASDTWFIHYEHGGIGLHSHLVALTRAGHSWRIVYAGTAFYAYPTLPKLRHALRT